MNDRTCKCCGQTLPAIEGFDLALSRDLKRLVERVRLAGKHGISTDRLFHFMYGDDRSGGPETGVKVLHVRVNACNRELRKQGWEIAGEHSGNARVYGNYRLQPVQPRKKSRRWAPKTVEPDPHNLVETNWRTTPCR